MEIVSFGMESQPIYNYEAWMRILAVVRMTDCEMERRKSINECDTPCLSRPR